MLALAALALPAALTATPARQAGDAGPDSLTIQEAVARVLATHPAVQEAGQGIAAAQARVRERQSAFLPVVAAEGRYSRIGPVAKLDFDNRAFELFPANSYMADVSLHQTLYDWGKREAAVEQARTGEQAAAGNVHLVKSRLAYRTIGAFYAIIFLRDEIAVQDGEIAALQRHLAIAREKVQSGTATDFEVLTTRVRIATARSQRVDLVDALEEQTIALRQLMGAPSDEPLTLVGDFEADTSGVNADSLVAAALSQRPELTLARSAQASAGATTHLASLGNRPALSLNLSVGGKNGYVPDLNQIRPNFVAGIAFDFPFYDGSRTRARVAESEANLRAAEAHAKSVERQVTAEVRQAAAAVRASVERIAAARFEVEQAEAALALARTRYQAGVITNLDILDAQTSLAGARLVELRARYGLVRSRYRLREAVGEQVW